MDFQPLLQQFRALQLTEKLDLLARLWDEIAENPDALEVSEEQRRLIDERLRQHEESPDDVADWDDVQADALARIRNRQP